MEKTVIPARIKVDMRKLWGMEIDKIQEMDKGNQLGMYI